MGHSGFFGRPISGLIQGPSIKAVANRLTQSKTQKLIFGFVLVLVNWRKNDAIGFREIPNVVNHPSTVT
jgi:hypothetical protein